MDSRGIGQLTFPTAPSPTTTPADDRQQQCRPAAESRTFNRLHPDSSESRWDSSRKMSGWLRGWWQSKVTVIRRERLVLGDKDGAETDTTSVRNKG